MTGLVEEHYHDHDPANEQDVIGLDHFRRGVDVWRGGFDFAFRPPGRCASPEVRKLIDGS